MKPTHDHRRFDDPRRDVAKREALALSLEDREHHDRHADVGDRHQQDLKESSELHTPFHWPVPRM